MELQKANPLAHIPLPAITIHDLPSKTMTKLQDIASTNGHLKTSSQVELSHTNDNARDDDGETTYKTIPPKLEPGTQFKVTEASATEDVTENDHSPEGDRDVLEEGEGGIHPFESNFPDESYFHDDGETQNLLMHSSLA